MASLMLMVCHGAIAQKIIDCNYAKPFQFLMKLEGRQELKNDERNEMRFLMHDSLDLEIITKPTNILRDGTTKHFLWVPDNAAGTQGMVVHIVSASGVQPRKTYCANVSIPLPFYVNRAPVVVTATTSRSLAVPTTSAWTFSFADFLRDEDGDQLTARWIVQPSLFPPNLPNLAISLPANWQPPVGVRTDYGKIEVSDGRNTPVIIEMTFNYAVTPVPPVFNVCPTGISTCDYPTTILEGEQAVALNINALNPLDGSMVPVHIAGTDYGMQVNNLNNTLTWTPGHRLVSDDKVDEVNYISVTFEATINNVPPLTKRQTVRFGVKNQPSQADKNNYNNFLLSADTLSNAAAILFCQTAKVVDENSYRIDRNRDVMEVIRVTTNTAGQLTSLFAGPVWGTAVNTIVKVGTAIGSNNGNRKELMLAAQIQLFGTRVSELNTEFKAFDEKYKRFLSENDNSMLTPAALSRMHADVRALRNKVSAMSRTHPVEIQPLFRPKRTPMPGLPQCN